RHHRGDTLFRGEIDDGAHLGAEDPEPRRSAQKRVEIWHRLHYTDAVFLGVEALVDLYKRDNTSLFPQERRRGLSAHLAVHRAFKKNRRDDLGIGKGWRSHDAHAHLMHE